MLELGEQIVALDGSLGRDVWVRGERQVGCIWVDSAVHPEFQGRGLSKLHLQHFIQRWADVYQPVSVEQGSDNPRLDRSSGPGSERRRLANLVEILARPVAKRSTARLALTRPSIATLRQILHVLRAPGGTTESGGIDIGDVATFDPGADDLWARAREEFDYAVARDSEYLNWRYCDPRAGRYRRRSARRGSSLVGFSVLATSDQQAKVVDLLVAPGDEEALTALIADALDVARADGASGISLQLPRVHPYRATLEQFGFARVDSVPNMGHRPRNDTLLDFLNSDPAARIHVAFGDSDHV